MAKGKKTGGRVVGSVNRPKAPDVPTDVAAPVATPVATAAPPAPPLAPASSARTSAPAREGPAPPAAIPAPRAAKPGKPGKRPNLLAASLKVETWPIERLNEYAGNPRNNDGAVGRMVDQIKAYGFRIPIVARSDGTLVDGHLRLKAARKLKLAEVPVALADDLTETQVKAFRLAVNKSAEWASWNPAKLRLEIKDLKLAKYDLDLTGFDEGEIAEYEDDPPLRPEPPVRTTKKTIECPACSHVFAP